MATLRESLEIAATVRRVYAFLADVERAPEWLPHVIEAECTSDVSVGEGAVLELVAEAGGRKTTGTTRCVSATPSSQLVFETRLAIGLMSTATFDLAARGRHTELTLTLDYKFEGHGLSRLIGGLFGDKVVRQDTLAGLEHLKAQIEAEAAKAPRRRRAATKR